MTLRYYEPHLVDLIKIGLDPHFHVSIVSHGGIGLVTDVIRCSSTLPFPREVVVGIRTERYNPLLHSHLRD
ncbi:hypothetical protein Leryth_015601 [Lithospermum erythrorhizon]|nr:hypothetical protein Leryth_015601 [Lithospermum erythrorhizon]